MTNKKISRRDILKATTAIAATAVFAEPLRAQAPAAEAITPGLIEAANLIFPAASGHAESSSGDRMDSGVYEEVGLATTK